MVELENGRKIKKHVDQIRSKKEKLDNLQEFSLEEEQPESGDNEDPFHDETCTE